MISSIGLSGSRTGGGKPRSRHLYASTADRRKNSEPLMSIGIGINGELHARPGGGTFWPHRGLVRLYNTASRRSHILSGHVTASHPSTFFKEASIYYLMRSFSLAHVYTHQNQSIVLAGFCVVLLL